RACAARDHDGASLAGVSRRARRKPVEFRASCMALLALQNASLRFGGIVAIEAQENTIFGLIGPNGAGKTTAFNVITRLYRLDSGDIVFDGRSLLHTPPSRVVGLGIARTFQNVELFPTMTVLEN